MESESPVPCTPSLGQPHKRGFSEFVIVANCWPHWIYHAISHLPFGFLILIQISIAHVGHSKSTPIPSQCPLWIKISIFILEMTPNGISVTMFSSRSSCTRNFRCLPVTCHSSPRRCFRATSTDH